MKLYYEALSKIPEKFIHDKTQCCTVGEDKVILANPNFPPMIYYKEIKTWKDLEPEFQPFLFKDKNDTSN